MEIELRIESSVNCQSSICIGSWSWYLIDVETPGINDCWLPKRKSIYWMFD